MENSKDEELGLKVVDRCVFCQIIHGKRERERVVYEV